MKHDTYYRRNRARTRGAAMVEAVIVISTMLVFLGLIVWVRQAYGMKLDMQQKTRSEVLYFASHACEATGGGVGQASVGGTVPGDNPAATVAQRSGLPEAAAVNRSWNTASGSVSGTANWHAVWDENAGKGAGNAPIRFGKRALTSHVSAYSSVTCNEKRYESQILAWAQFGLRMARSGGGVMDLFQ